MPDDQRFKLTASNIARYFKLKCDRLYRWEAVDQRVRGTSGIGWNVPKRDRSKTPPRVKLLMGSGDTFEREQIEALLEDLGADRVHMGPIVMGRGGREVIEPLPLADFRAFFDGGDPPAFVAQLDVDLEGHAPEAAAAFLERFGLDSESLALSAARPDLVEVLRADDGYRLRVWDYKASASARHEHFVQVAFYTLLLEDAIAALGLEGVRVDTEVGVIRTREEDPTEFKLRPYRDAVARFLRGGVPGLHALAAADAHFHVSSKCLLCEYLEVDRGCQKEADAGFDLSRVAYLTSESKRHLVAAGIPTHRALAAVRGDSDEAAALRELSHDLSVHLDRYIAAARALDDGESRTLAASTLQMPYWDDVRVVLTAEQDGVTTTCFALGVKTFEGWDAEANRPVGVEEVFVAEEPNSEADLLLRFLRCLNGVLERVDAENRAITAPPIDEEPDVAAAAADLQATEDALAAFKDRSPNRLYKARPEHVPLIAERDRLKDAVRTAKADLRQARKDAEWERVKRQRTLHIYVYDDLDLNALKGALERHLLDAPPELRREIIRLVRLFPPESVLPDADTMRTIPGTVVVGALRQLVALPVPYLYDLATVSRLYRPTKADGSPGGSYFWPEYGFGWRHSNQVAFERIHEVWAGQPFERGAQTLTAEEVAGKIADTVRDKLRATDSVVRALKETHKAAVDGGGLGLLLLKKEPFRLHEGFDPTDHEALDALRVFSLVESALAEIKAKHVHTLSVGDRAAKFEAVRGLRYLDGQDTTDASGAPVLWFEFDPACRDAKYSEGQGYLVITPEARPEVLVNQVGGRLFDNREFWRYKDYQVSIEAIDLRASPPRIALRPDHDAKFRAALDLTETLVLDKPHSDATTPWVLDVLARLQSNPGAAAHLAALVEHGTVPGWTPFFRDVRHAEHGLRALIAGAVGDDGAPLDPDHVLNDGQWRAWRGVFCEPLTMIWGPPGTGKTHLLGHVVLGYALAARRLGRPLRLLVTAFTHHAIANVLRKAAELAALYGVDPADLGLVKLGAENAADAEFDGMAVGRIEDVSALAAAVADPAPGCLVVGSTVWGVYKATRNAPGPGAPLFDVVLVDEASQLKLPDAIVALASLRDGGSVILAGDDRQLPPIIHGAYPEDHEPMLSSVFAYARHKLDEREEWDPGARDRTLFKLTLNYRMNEPLTAYPREVVYEGTYEAEYSGRRIRLDPAPGTPDGLVDLLVDPERPVMLAWYRPPRAFTARNSLEAEVAAAVVDRLSRTLVDPNTRAVYDPDAFAARGVAVLSPHNAQNAAVRAALREVGFDAPGRPMPLVDTVDKLQGKERDAVVVSYGVADAEYADAEADFLLSQNRFNVSATRGRAKLVVLASDVVLNAVPNDRRVLLESMMVKEFRTYCSAGRVTVPFESADFGMVDITVQWRAFDDKEDA